MNSVRKYSNEIDIIDIRLRKKEKLNKKMKQLEEERSLLNIELNKIRTKLRNLSVDENNLNYIRLKSDEETIIHQLEINSIKQHIAKLQKRNLEKSFLN